MFPSDVCPLLVENRHLRNWVSLTGNSENENHMKTGPEELNTVALRKRLIWRSTCVDGYYQIFFTWKLTFSVKYELSQKSKFWVRFSEYWCILNWQLVLELEHSCYWDGLDLSEEFSPVMQFLKLLNPPEVQKSQMCLFAAVFLSYNLFPWAICITHQNSAGQLFFSAVDFAKMWSLEITVIVFLIKKIILKKTILVQWVTGFIWSPSQMRDAWSSQSVRKAPTYCPPSTSTCTCLLVSPRPYLSQAAQCNSARGSKPVLEARGDSAQKWGAAVHLSFPCSLRPLATWKWDHQMI